MGQLVLPPSGSIYVDTSALIYHVERIEPYFLAAAPLWQAVAHGQLEVNVSYLALLEVLVKPLKLQDHALVALYRRLLTETTGIRSRAIDQDVLEVAAQLRVDHNLRTPDAIHAATAVVHGCKWIITNDPTFRRVPGLSVILLKEIAAS